MLISYFNNYSRGLTLEEAGGGILYVQFLQLSVNLKEETEERRAKESYPNRKEMIRE